MLSSRKSLGLAVTEQGIAVVEAGSSGGVGRAVLHTAWLPFSANVGLDQPEKLGKELRQVLRRGGFASSRCVIGLAAAWLAAKEKSLPPGRARNPCGEFLPSPPSVNLPPAPRNLLSITCNSRQVKASPQLLVAAQRRTVQQLAAAAKAARLSVSAITASAAALAFATRGPVGPGGRLVFCLLPNGAEVAVQSAGGMRLIRHLPVRLDQGGDRADALSGEIRRVLALVPAAESAGGREMLFWNSVGLDRSSIDSIGRGLGLPLRLCELAPDLQMNGAASSAGDKFAQAAALACWAAGSQSIDFLHSRLAPPKKAKVGRLAMWGAAAAVVLLAAGIYFFLNWRADQQAVADLQGKLDSSKSSVAEAKTLVDNVSFAGGWYDRRPRFLDCLREITQAFPQEGRISATSLTVREDMQAVVLGKSVSESAALELLDRLKADPRLDDIKPLYIRQAGGTSKEVSFAISLHLRGAN